MRCITHSQSIYPLLVVRRIRHYSLMLTVIFVIAAAFPRIAAAQKTIFERLDDRCHRVEKHDLMQRRISHITQRIHDRRRVHPQRHKHPEEIRQVPVFGCRRGDDQSEAQRQTLHHHHQNGEQQQIPVRVQMHALDDVQHIYEHKRDQLQAKAEHLRDYLRYRRHQTREIDLAEQTRIALERTRSIRQTGREILPQTDTAQVEHRLRDVIRRDTGNTTEHHDVHEHREQRRDEVPPHTEDRLLVLHRDIALDKQPNQVLLLPKFLQPQPLCK